LPRRLDAERLAVLVPEDPADFGRGFAVDSVRVADGTRRRLGTVPEFRCDSTMPNLWPVPLSIQQATDFEVDGARERVCLRLQDRNTNMANVALDVVVDLSDGAVRRWLAFAEPGCNPGRDVQLGAATERCDPVNQAPAFWPELRSPSGRWLLDAVEAAEGDYMHWRLLLVDVDRREVFAVPSRAGAWPKPLARLGHDTALGTPLEDASDVVAESDVRWLGQDEGSELLVIDDLVVRPGHGAFSVQGQVVQ
jgi:hypothetical protein